MRQRCAVTVRSPALSSITAAIGVATIAAVGILGVYVGKALPGHHAASDDRRTSTASEHRRHRCTGHGRAATAATAVRVRSTRLRRPRRAHLLRHR